MIKRSLFISAMVLAVIAFITMFAPLSSHIYTVEKAKPYPTVTSWTEDWTSTSYTTATVVSIKSKATFRDDPGDSFAAPDIDLLILEREADLLHVYLSLSHGEINPYDWIYYIVIDFDGDVAADYTVWLDYEGCQLWKYHDELEGVKVSNLRYEVDDSLLHVVVPLRKIEDKTFFYVWAGVGFFARERGRWQLYHLDTIGYEEEYDINNPIDLEATYSITKTFRKAYTYTSTLSSIYTLTSTETHTLTEKVPLSYWHGWLPVLFFALAGVAGATLLIIPETRRGEKAPLAVALPAGVRLVRICPSCGTENPLDAEYCMECGAKLR